MSGFGRTREDNPVEITLAKKGIVRWVDMSEVPVSEQARLRCTPRVVAAGLSGMSDMEVVSVTLESSGEWTTRPGQFGFPETTLTGLPEFCDVRVRRTSPSGRSTEIVVWVPLAWNGRFMGVGGGGNRTGGEGMIFELPAAVSPGLASAVRNGFAAAGTDGGNQDSRLYDWALDEASGRIDWELVDNWIHHSTHEMTLLGKAVVEAIHGRHPAYSYFVGGSGGGRQALMEAQRYPDDYDGIWSIDPVISYSKLYMAEFWPTAVMNEYGPIPVAKMEKFRDAAVSAAGGDSEEGLNFVPTLDAPDLDPFVLVGTPTAAGDITDSDATVMQKIWEGPRTEAGEFLWFGIRPGSRSWQSGGFGLAATEESDGLLSPVPFMIAERYLAGWILRDPGWDWRTLGVEGFRKLFDQSVEEFRITDTDDPDLSAFQRRGGKLLLSHGLDDSVIPSAGTVRYFDAVVQAMGGDRGTADFARLFLAPGAGHCTLAADGPGITLADGMIGLMNWVENSEAPESFIGERWTRDGTELLSTRPIYRYPRVAQYSGSADPLDAANYGPDKAT